MGSHWKEDFPKRWLWVRELSLHTRVDRYLQRTQNRIFNGLQPGLCAFIFEQSHGQISYVGSSARHIVVITNPNGSKALINPALSAQSYQPFPDFAGATFSSPNAMSDYNSLQTTVEKRFSNGLSFLATYTWAHSLDDAPDPFGSNADGGFRSTNLLPISYDYSNSAFDVRNRVTFNGLYELPFGTGRAYLNRKGIPNLIARGWMTSLTFVDQSGPPITVSPNIATAVGGSARAILVGDPFAAGGAANSANNPGVSCAPRTKNKTNWYNPCAFANLFLEHRSRRDHLRPLERRRPRHRRSPVEVRYWHGRAVPPELYCDYSFLG